ncbi:hypothetical protein HRbin29_01791 [bacterium HR29]|jgi:competence protein ComFC|nr:hypothetical protein HRbin29_01791 [bacterium HR29]
MAALPVRRMLRLVVDALYPPQCVGCGRWGDFLCPRCLARADAERPQARCGHCDAAWAGEGFCPRCLPLSRLAAVRAAFEFTGVARRAVHQLKYGFTRALAEPMAAAMTARLDLSTYDAAVPVPIHPSRQRWRGFDQAAELARGLPLPPAPGRLRRIRKTRSQVGLSAAERRRNLAGAFVYEGPPLSGLRIALIDDVVTSGATAAECAAVLLDAGAAQVTALAFARASYETSLADAPIRE